MKKDSFDVFSSLQKMETALGLLKHFIEYAQLTESDSGKALSSPVEIR